MAKVLIVAANTRSLVDNRGDLINEIKARGHDLLALIPKSDFDKEKIKEISIDYKLFSLSRQKMNPFSDLYSVYDLYNKIKEYKPDYVFSYTIKPIVYGSTAAGLARVKNIYSMVTGLGYLFIGNSMKKKTFKKLALIMYKAGFIFNQKVFFQNFDDIKLFKSANIIKEKKITKVNGSGVNTDYYQAYFKYPMKPRFLVIARLLEDKGIYEYVKAAKILKERYPEAEFNLLGPYDDNPSAITETEVKNWTEQGLINYLGKTKDVRPYIKNSDVVVLPSYREGTPRVNLEAMSMARTVVTTDVPGCRETVEVGYNGFLAEVKNPESLAAAMEKFIKNPELIKKMGKRARKFVKEKYDVNKVNEIIINTMGL